MMFSQWLFADNTDMVRNIPIQHRLLEAQQAAATHVSIWARKQQDVHTEEVWASLTSGRVLITNYIQ